MQNCEPRARKSSRQATPKLPLRESVDAKRHHYSIGDSMGTEADNGFNSESMKTAIGQKKKEEGARLVRYFGPLLDALRALGGSGTPDEVVERIALDLGLSDDVQNELLPSGEPRYRNQVAWARFYLVREGLLDSSRRGSGASPNAVAQTKLSPAHQFRAQFFGGGSVFATAAGTGTAEDADSFHEAILRCW
jgi:hypothetical protein